jgi:hypothetical protein
MLRMRGSLTVEAAIILPVVLAVFTVAIKSGIDLYEETRDRAVAVTETGSPDILKRFYQWKMLEGLVDEEKTN